MKMKMENGQFIYTEEDFENAVKDYYCDYHGVYVTPSIIRSLDDEFMDLEGNFMKAYYKYSIGELEDFDELDELMEKYGKDWLLNSLESGEINSYGIDDFFYDVFLEPAYTLCDLDVREFYEKYNGWNEYDILEDYFKYDGDIFICDDAVILGY